MLTTQLKMQEKMATNNLVGLEVDVAIFVKPEGQTDGEVGCIGQVGGVSKKNIYQKCQTQPKMTLAAS